MANNKEVKKPQERLVHCYNCKLVLGSVRQGVYGNVSLWCPRCGCVTEAAEYYTPARHTWK